MRQALHIFRKDVRHLWGEISLALAITAAFTFIGTRQAFWLSDPRANRNVAWMMATILLPLAWAILVERAIHAETLPGSRQFWITRPYKWTSLLGAKVLFAAVFVNLPLLIADVIILRAFGFNIETQISGLLWTQVLLVAVFLLPVGALSAVTTGFAEMLSISLVFLVLVLVWNIAAPARVLGAIWGPLDWIPAYYAMLVTVGAALVILIWQYKRKGTWIALSVAAAAAVCAIGGSALSPWTTAFAIQSRLNKQQVNAGAIHVGFDANKKWLAHALVDKDEPVEIDLPLEITGIPAGMEPRPDGAIATIEAPDGTVWRTERQPWEHAASEADIVSLRTEVAAAFYRKIKNEPVKIRGILYFTLYGNPRTSRILFGGGPVPAAGMGLCSASQSGQGRTSFLLCSSAFRAKPDLVSIRFVEAGKNTYEVRAARGPLRRISYSPFPAEVSMSPVSQYFTYRVSAQPLSEVVIDSVEPLTHEQREFEIDKLRLSDFEVGLGTGRR
ncbi:MAG TPA: hypothetical protein VGL97_20990 [Bryobacteraceae bacterium]